MENYEQDLEIGSAEDCEIIEVDTAGSYIDSVLENISISLGMDIGYDTDNLDVE